ncbi:protein of unknown function [Shinella sp. WSC3-e]|nr:protein of unknown function [Shinella sp. WSC3-e]
MAGRLAATLNKSLKGRARKNLPWTGCDTVAAGFVFSIE